jgi:hypothetical protein
MDTRRSVGQASAGSIFMRERLSMQARRRRLIEAAAQIACFAAQKFGPGKMTNESKTSLSNAGPADHLGAAGRAPNLDFLNHCIVGGLPNGGSGASGKSCGRREP